MTEIKGCGVHDVFKVWLCLGNVHWQTSKPSLFLTLSFLKLFTVFQAGDNEPTNNTHLTDGAGSQTQKTCPVSI